ncbi:YraN family protein [Aestuariibius sp. 2305UL40-4]|uniref:YraN family protein n=1 Tax=Aestuariibius violaceus TaxID=3234132 RepID=UPI00345E1EC9
MSGKVSFAAGFAAEESVVDRYRRKGCEVAARRWRGSVGEIDIVLRDPVDDGLIFVEVKKSRSFGKAAERLNRKQMNRICATAEEFAAGEPRGLLTDMRFDVALMNGIGDVRILENAFGEA